MGKKQWYLVIMVMWILIPQIGSAMQLIRIGTGGLMGVYYPIGKIIAEGLTDATTIGVAQTSGGSIANVRALANKEIEMALVQADVAYWAFHQTGPFLDMPGTHSIRAIASLYPEQLQIVTRADAQIRSFESLRGKRISLDEEGSGTLEVMRIALKAHGLNEKDLSAVYLKPEFTTQRLSKGELDGFCVVAGTPMSGITAVEDLDLFLVPVASDIASKIQTQYPWLIPAVIPEGAYRNVPQTPTIEVYALLIVHATMDDSLVEEILEKVWSEQMLTQIHQGHPRGISITLDSAFQGISIPLHPGAVTFYQDKGMIAEEDS